MPHQCVKCGRVYDDGTKVILKGCTDCGGKMFFYIKKEALEKKRKVVEELTSREKEQIESDIYDIMGSEIDKEIPIVLDIESINILKPCKYEVDLIRLFNKNPLVYKLEEGKYMIDIVESFRELSDKKGKE